MVAIHSTLMPHGKVLFFYNNPTFGDEDAAKVMVWDPTTRTGCGATPHRTSGAPGRSCSPTAACWWGGNLEYQDPVNRNLPGTPFGGSTRSGSSTWSPRPGTQGPSMCHGRSYPTATRLADGRELTAGWDETGNGSSANNSDVELYTPAADGNGPGTVLVGDNDLDSYPHQFVLPDGRVLIAGPRIDDTYYVNPAAGFAFTQAPDLNVDRVFGYGVGVLLPGPPSGSSKVMLIGGATTGEANASTATTEQLDPADPSAGWQFRAPLPQSRRNVNGVLLPDGGSCPSAATRRARATGTERRPSSIARRRTRGRRWRRRRRAGATTPPLPLPDATVLSAGDDTEAGRGWINDVAEVFAPPYLFRGGSPAIASAPASAGYGTQLAIGASGQVSRAVLVAPAATHMPTT